MMSTIECAVLEKWITMKGKGSSDNLRMRTWKLLLPIYNMTCPTRQVNQAGVQFIMMVLSCIDGLEYGRLFSLGIILLMTASVLLATGQQGIYNLLCMRLLKIYSIDLIINLSFSHTH